MTQRIKEQKNVEIGLKFMNKEGVEVTPPTVKRVFLQKKGLKEEEIEKVFRLHEEIKQKRFKDSTNEASQKPQ